MENGYWYEDQNPSERRRQERPKKSVSFLTLIACMLITGLLGGVLGSVIMNGSLKKTAQIEEAAPPQIQQEQEAPQEQEANNSSSNMQLMQALPHGAYSRAEIIENCAPTVVGIDVETTSNNFWYGQSTVTTGSGSGVIISSDGYIITNNHVIEGAQKVTVYLQDDSEYEATLVGTDAKTDLAVIKIEATGLPYATMGSSDNLVVGEDVVAIGNPLGELRGTATGGMVSALSREITFDDGTQMRLLQTDAAINPGNSGGGLFNGKGELIGVVNAKVASSSTEGLGFAIPIDSAKDVISDLMDLGYVTGRAHLGVYTQDVAIRTGAEDGRNSGWGDFFGFGGGSMQGMETRVQVVRIVLDSAAEAAGIQAGDLILKVDDIEITTGTELSAAIGEYKAGDAATITIQREGKEQQLSVTFGELIPE